MSVHQMHLYAIYYSIESKTLYKNKLCVAIVIHVQVFFTLTLFDKETYDSFFERNDRISINKYLEIWCNTFQKKIGSHPIVLKS